VRAEAKGGMNFMKLLDFSTNPFALRDLELACQLAPVEQIPAIAAVVEKEPNHLGSCITLLTSLRQNHIFENSTPIEPLTKEVHIPKSIVQFWDAKQIPYDLDLFMQSARLTNRDFEHHVFDDIGAEEFIRQECAASVLRAYRTANHPAMRADIFRLAYLSIKGGIYIDADDRCTHSLEGLLEFGYELIVMQEGDGSIGNNFLAATPNHPWISHALDTVTSFVNQRQGDNIWLVSGPGAISGSFVHHYLTDFSQSKMPSGVKVMPQYRTERFISMHLPTCYKKAGGHWVSRDTKNDSIYKLPFRLKK
jgi:mannosyltransferase OCH1-like enzyme